MTLYESLPQRRHAVKWSGSNTDELTDLKALAHPDAKFFVEVVGPEDDPEPTGILEVLTVDGNRVNVPVGAYVVLDGKSWPYPCDAEIFEANNREV